MKLYGLEAERILQDLEQAKFTAQSCARHIENNDLENARFCARWIEEVIERTLEFFEVE